MWNELDPEQAEYLSNFLEMKIRPVKVVRSRYLEAPKEREVQEIESRYL